MINVAPADLIPGDYCRAKVPLLHEPGNFRVWNCQVEEVIERDGAGKIFRMATQTRRDLVAIPQSDVVGLGWRKA